jgi:hypothetical protein
MFYLFFFFFFQIIKGDDYYKEKNIPISTYLSFNLKKAPTNDLSLSAPPSTVSTCILCIIILTLLFPA